MISIRKSEDRGISQLDWLKSYHSFSFASYYDASQMGFGVLRVINEDFVRPSSGFATHAHRDMEIITYLISGRLEHKDSTGNQGHLTAEEVQTMSAGYGIRHSEMNVSSTEELHLLQIWITPQSLGGAPRYSQKTFLREQKLHQWRLIASPDEANGSLPIRQNARIYATILAPQQTLTFEVPSKRSAWVQVVRGEVQLESSVLKTGDGAGIDLPATYSVSTESLETEVLWFDLP